MRRKITIIASIIAALSLTSSALAAEVLTLEIAEGDTVPVSEDGSLTYVGTADFGDAVPGEAGPALVFEDPAEETGDGITTAAVKVPHADLVAGFIAETSERLAFTWQVRDLPDPPLYAAKYALYAWQFTLDGTTFDLDTWIEADGTGWATLWGGCRTTDEGPQCELLPADIEVSYDGVEDTVTAAVARESFVDTETGDVRAVDGATLREFELYQGIAAFTAVSQGVHVGPLQTFKQHVKCRCTSDKADMNGPYVLGRHVEAALVDAAEPQSTWLDAFPMAVGPAPEGSYEIPLELNGFEAGDYKALARACVGRDCGAITSTDVTLTDGDDASEERDRRGPKGRSPADPPSERRD